MNLKKNKKTCTHLGSGDRRSSVSGSWHELFPGSATRPPQERRTSCCIHDTPLTDRCLHCCSPANEDKKQHELCLSTRPMIWLNDRGRTVRVATICPFCLGSYVSKLKVVFRWRLRFSGPWLFAETFLGVQDVNPDSKDAVWPVQGLYRKTSSAQRLCDLYNASIWLDVMAH